MLLDIVNEMFSFVRGILDIANSFADVWYLDHEYLENMYHMFKKVPVACV